MQTRLPKSQCLQRGDKCRILIPNKRDYNKVAVFLNRSVNGNYLFHSAYNKKEIIVCHDETQFVLLPTEHQLKGIIDLCLDIGSKDMFDDFSNQLLEGDFN